MSLFKRLKELLIALVTALFGIILLFAGEEGQLIVIDIICLCLFFEGIRLLVYYLWMARHMVEGKRVLIRSIIILDLGMLTLQMVSMSLEQVSAMEMDPTPKTLRMDLMAASRSPAST